MDVTNVFKRPDFWLSLVLVALMFAVWVNVWPYELRGYDLLEGVVTGAAERAPGIFFSALMPIGILGIWIAGFRNEWWPACPILAGIGAVGAIGYLFSESQNDFGMSIESAGWATFFVGILLVVSPFFSRPKSAPSEPSEAENKSN